jgi:hypothetical protein
MVFLFVASSRDFQSEPAVEAFPVSRNLNNRIADCRGGYQPA